MAWSCSGRTNKELVDKLVREKLISTPRVAQAFYAVDRGDFIGLSPYQDSPQPIGQGATITAPHMHANAIENLSKYLVPGAKVLDVGCGSGYLLAIFHLLVSPPPPISKSPEATEQGLVVGIDHLPYLTELSRSNLMKSFRTAVDEVRIQVICADGRKGAPAVDLPEGGFDVIHVGAAAPTLPEELLAQLKAPGRMFIPVGEGSQAIWQIDRDEQGEITMEKLYAVRYVPLTDAESQYPSKGGVQSPLT